MRRTVLLLAALAIGPAHADDYGAMLDYLAQSRVDGAVFAGASGALALNVAAGDHNLQIQQRAIAVGPRADAATAVRQTRHGDRSAAPAAASAVIAGRAFSGASGLAGIHQASGHGNAAFNAVALALAQQGIREADDDQALSSAFASAGQQHGFEHGGATTDRRVASVESTALQGFEGVLQLTQVAGSGNDTGNALSMSIQAGP